MAEKQRKIIKPQKGFQEKFVRSNVDVCFGGGAAGVGKTFAACLIPAEYFLNPKFRGLYTRRNLGDSKSGGGMIQEFKGIYGNSIAVKESDTPRIIYKPTGAIIDFQHIADEKYQVVENRVKGMQYDLIYMDEITTYLEFTTFLLLATRVRGKSGIGSKIRGTLNPEYEHWYRKFIDWYVGEDGYIIPERDGVVRYFFIAGEDVDSVVWGNTKEEVYEKCKSNIDSLLANAPKKFTYRNIIKSFVFYEGTIYDNQELLNDNPDYIGNLAMGGANQASRLLRANHNTRKIVDDSLPIPVNSATQVFSNDPQQNNDWWITVDLAGQGKDNTVMIVWNGFHIEDVMMLNVSDAQGNATACRVLAEKWNIAHSRIIFDATNGMYFKSYIPEARTFISRNSARGLYKTTYQYMKDECAYRLTEMIKGDYISFSEKVANMQYKHQKLTAYTSIKTEFIQECYALRFKDKGNGKRALYTKVEMNAILGKSRSMDLLDPCLMRMMPIVQSVIGEELFWNVGDRPINNNDSFQTDSYRYRESIYDLLED